MDRSILAGMAALFFTVLYLVTGFPLQLKELYAKAPRTPALYWSHLSGFLMYAGWSLYGYAQDDHLLAFGQLLGFFGAAITTGHLLWLSRQR